MRRVVHVLFVLVLAGMIASAWYAYDKGFTKKWRGFVAEEFRKRGVEVTLRRLTLDPFRGLVAKDVRVYDTRDRRRTLAVVNEVILGLNYANAIRGRTFLDSLDLRDARLTLPLDPEDPKGPKLEISRLNARLFLPPEQIYLARAEAEAYGIRISAAGRLLHPQAFRQARERTGESARLAGKVIDELKALKWSGARPVLSIEFSGDLAEPEGLFARARLQGEKVERRNYLLERVDIAAAYRGGALELQQLRLQDARGTLDAHANVRLQGRKGALRLRSSLDLPELLRAVGLRNAALGEFVFHESPTLELTADVQLEGPPRWQTLVHTALGRFSYRGIEFDRLSGDASWDGSRWYVRDAHLVHKTGELTAHAMQAPGAFRARGKSTINPQILSPLLSGKAAEWFAQWNFTDSPEFEVLLEGTAATLDACRATGRVQCGRTAYRGVGAERFSAAITYADRQLTLGDFLVERAEGTGTGTMIFDFKRDEVRLKEIRTTLLPSEVIGWIDPKLAKDVAPYGFAAGPPTLSIDGLVHTKGGKSTRLTIQAEAPDGMEYTFLKQKLQLSQFSGDLLFTAGQLRLTGLNATLFGGQVELNANVSLQKTRPGYDADLRLRNVDFASLTRLYFKYDDSKGRLTGQYRFTGRDANARTMAGEGELRVSQGNVFAIPFLGPLSGVLNAIVPGMGFNVARKASATFQVRQGAIRTKDLEIEGNGFSMLGEGALFFLDDKMDFAMRINAQGLPGVLLFPVSKLFEYVADDRLSKPNWRPKALPRF